MSTQQFCPSCGHPNQAAAQFCGSCGTPILVVEQSRRGWFMGIGIFVLALIGIGFLALGALRESGDKPTTVTLVTVSAQSADSPPSSTLTEETAVILSTPTTAPSQTPVPADTPEPTATTTPSSTPCAGNLSHPC